MRLFLVLSLFLIALLTFNVPASVQAGAITVDGTCTLVDAIIAANTDAPSGSCPAGSGADVITLDVNVTITTSYIGHFGLPAIISDITIQAGTGNIIAGNGVDILLFWLNDSDSRLTLNDVTVQDSRHLSQYNPGLGISFPAIGGAMVVEHPSAEVYINNSVFQNNAAIGQLHPNGNGENATGGAIFNFGYLEVNNSVFQNNFVTAVNGSFGQDITASGGAIANIGTLIIQSSTFTSNHVEVGGADLIAIGVGGAIHSAGSDLTIRDSTISNNSVQSHGPNILLEDGGGLYVEQVPTTIERSLFWGNSVLDTVEFEGNGGAIAIDIDGQFVSITNSTFYENEANNGGAIFHAGEVAGSADVLAFNTFLDNTSSPSGADVIALDSPADMLFTGNIIISSNAQPDCSGMTASNGSDNLNLSGDTSCDVISSGNIIPGTHFSTTLTDEGLGVPEFFPLINVGSNPAIDAVPGCGLTEDQRGLPRDTNCDVGSYELQGGGTPTDTPIPPTDTPIPPTDTPGPVNLVASAACVDENLAVTISAGDAPFNITASAGINTPVNGVNIGTTTINGPEKWDNLTVIETSGNGESINLGQFRCRSDERPVPVSPAHRSRTTNPFPTFSWTGISNANNYRVFVFDDANPATRTVDIRQNSGGPTMMTLTTPLPDGRLFWRVRGRQNRLWSLWSVRFTLFKDPPPSLSAPTPVPTLDLDTAPTIQAPQPTVVPTFPVPPNSR